MAPWNANTVAVASIDSPRVLEVATERYIDLKALLADSGDNDFRRREFICYVFRYPKDKGPSSIVVQSFTSYKYKQNFKTIINTLTTYLKEEQSLIEETA